MNCISSGYKDLLIGMLTDEAAHDFLTAVVKGMPLCEEKMKEQVLTFGTARGAAAIRKVAAPWGIKPVFVDAEGKKTEYESPSALVKALGLTMSGIQCDIEGKKCKASSAIDILRIAGYTVSGDGEPRKAGEGGEKITVYHPDTIKEK